MNNILAGSDLTRAMLKRGDKDIWCAVADSSDEEAMHDQMDNDFTARIISFDNGSFLCSGGMAWAYAVAIKISAITQEEACLQLMPPEEKETC